MATATVAKAGHGFVWQRQSAWKMKAFRSFQAPTAAQQAQIEFA